MQMRTGSLDVVAEPQPSKEPTSSNKIAERLHKLQAPGTAEYLDKLRRRYSKHLAPIEEVRDMMDKALGEHLVTEELYRMRGCTEELRRQKVG